MVNVNISNLKFTVQRLEPLKVQYIYLCTNTYHVLQSFIKLAPAGTKLPSVTTQAIECSQFNYIVKSCS